MKYPQFNDFRELLVSKVNEQIVNRANELDSSDKTVIHGANTVSYIYPMMIELLEAYHLWMSKCQDEKESECAD